MALDFDAIRRKLDKLSGNNNSRNVMWKPEEGQECKVRLLSFPDNDGQPFKELQFYYNIPGQRGLLAPSQFGKRDPIQELINKLRDEGTKESYEMAKKLYPKMRVYAPVIVRGEESEGVRIWSFGKLVYQSLLSLMMDEDYGDITDLKTGTDLKIKCTKPPGQQWAKTEVLPVRKASALSKDSKQVKEWVGGIPDVNDIFRLKSYDELSNIINGWLNGEEESESTGSEWGGNKKTTDSSSDNNEEGKSYSSLDDAFSDLMN
tara:strand:- start:2737 stop:3519 length:783 start_codon:yes stop_codon:yes gene_type:complete